MKGLFLSIWRHVQSSVQELMSGYGQLHGGGFNTYKGALLRGTQLLNDKFVAAWTKDEYRDYLAPLIQVSTSSSSAGRNAVTDVVDMADTLDRLDRCVRRVRSMMLDSWVLLTIVWFVISIDQYAYSYTRICMYCTTSGYPIHPTSCTIDIYM